MDNFQDVSPPFIPGDGAKFPRVLVMPPTAGGSSDDTAYTIDLLTREASPVAVSGPALMHASSLHYAGGWFLMLSAPSGDPYLIEPCTGRRVDLPAMPLRHQLTASVFAVARGVPDTVVFFDRESRHPHVLVSRISDEGGAGAWESIRYLSTPGCGVFRYGAVVGDEVWYVDEKGTAVALDLRQGGGHWRVLCAAGWGRRNVGGGRQFFLVTDTAESGGPTVARVHCPPPCYAEFRFIRLDGQIGEWVPLTEGELEDTSWFLWQRCFMVRGVDGGKKVYLLSPDDEKREGVGGPSRVLRPLPAVQRGNVYVHDLDAGTSEPLFAEPFLMTRRFWVHPDCF